VAVALVAADRRVLMQRRRLDRAHGGLWEFPGGKIEAGESPELAASREIREELGVELDQSALHAVSFASASAIRPMPALALQAPPVPRQSQVILLYACRLWQGEPSCLDAEEIAWFALDRLEQLAMPPLDYPLARALRAGMEKGYLGACQS
jgi:8-oxo-dGTP diphosphatase